ncbi:efflux RND transporter periplasmic adaptor subunit [Actinomadura sp. DC4]|uniref:efflux RND transporter periplasmic adaptor subunit n=1 Tax=Actinomadura sp. DC4 TaxID=3055069 RepID=UPI0025B029C5|nr:efflux RND transporter periplasmic adaptor subunit [Actinomadura sp. DC4]MDN3354783.1 efflux RND transporter periplasmic adaptor subunit [Actinomadura sp. DC4]
MKLRRPAPNRLSRRTQVALGAFGVLVIGTATTVAIGSGGASGASPAYATVAEGDVTATAGASGNLESADSRDLAFGASGTVIRVYAKVGEKVREGARLAAMDRTQAEEDLASARAALAAAVATADGTDTVAAEGVTIVPAGYTPTPGASATPTPRSTPTPRAPARSPATTASRAPRGTGKSSGGGSASPEQSAARVTQAKNTLARAERALAGTVIKAPMAGTVLAVDGTAGDRASASSTFVTIGDLDDVQLQATFSQNDMASVRVGQQAKITLTAEPGTTYAGTVTHIDTNATTSDKLVKYGAMIAFDDVPSRILIGQSGTVSVTTASATDTLYVPSSAIRTGPNGTYTVRLRLGGTRTVRIGVRGDAYTEITSGLSKGDRVTTS